MTIGHHSQGKHFEHRIAYIQFVQPLPCVCIQNEKIYVQFGVEKKNGPHIEFNSIQFIFQCFPLHVKSFRNLMQ